MHVSHQSQPGFLSKNESNCLLENKIVYVSTGDASDHCSLFSQTFYGLLISYLTMYIINSQFLSCCTSQPKRLVKLTKSLL